MTPEYLMTEEELQKRKQLTTEERFNRRILRHVMAKKVPAPKGKLFGESRFMLPRLRHGFWWWAHNCVAHPLIGYFPHRKTFEFHDYTSDKINMIR